MIAKITLENFFSFREPTTIELNPDINVLIGINGSGKSNFLKAIQLLRESFIGNDGFEHIFLQDWGGFNAVVNCNHEKKDYIRLTFEFDKNVIKEVIQKQGFQAFQFPHNPIYEITIFRSGATAYYLKEKLYSKSTKAKDFIYMEMDNAQGIISTREYGIQHYPQKTQEIPFKSTELVLKQISDPNRFYPLYTLKTALEDFAVYHSFNTALHSPIRQPTTSSSEKKLLPSGQNLVTTLSRIKNNHSFDYDELEKAIKKINPSFKDIDFDLIGTKLSLVLRETSLTKSIPMEHISDGTLRYLLLLAVLFNPERGSLVCIDEPETNLHPDMINTVTEAIKQASRTTQLIIATHAPLLLNSFEIDDILVFEKTAQNETTVSIKSSDEFNAWSKDFLAGQAWLRGLIGGKRW